LCRGYCDYDWFAALAARGVSFVTRLKDNAAYVTVESRPVIGENVVADEIVAFVKHATEDNANFFRLVRHPDSEPAREFTFLTNHRDLPAAIIAATYKQRWQIELSFKAIKQNLCIKSFVGAGANALKIQVWTALIALLLIRYLQLRSKMAWHLSRFIALLRQQFLVYRDLWRFLDRPFDGPPEPNLDEEIPPSLFALAITTRPTPQPEPLYSTQIASAPMLAVSPVFNPG
jgi:hypothetical protein